MSTYIVKRGDWVFLKGAANRIARVLSINGLSLTVAPDDGGTPFNTTADDIGPIEREAVVRLDTSPLPFDAVQVLPSNVGDRLRADNARLGESMAKLEDAIGLLREKVAEQGAVIAEQATELRRLRRAK